LRKTGIWVIILFYVAISQVYKTPDRHRGFLSAWSAVLPKNSVIDKKENEGLKETSMTIQRQLNKREIVFIMAGLMISVLLSGLDSTIVGTAMPGIVGDLKGMDLYAWPFIAYMLCSTIAIILFGKISDIHGRKPIFLLGIITFLVGSILCGLSQTMPQLVVLRGLQGAGGGILISIAFTLLADLFSPRERGKYSGFLTSMWGVASIVGPAVGGFITDHYSWRWVFYVNIPVGLVAIVMVIATLPSFKGASTKKSIDYKGAVILILALVPLILAFSWAGTTYPWISGQILGMFFFAVIMLVFFYFIEKKTAEPIMSFSIYKNSILNISLAASFLSSAVMFCGLIYIPLFMQGVVGTSATASGFILTPMMLGLTIASIITGQLISRTGRYKIWAIIGFVILLVGIYFLYTMKVGTPAVRGLIYSALLGLGSGVMLPTFSVVVQNVFPRQQFGLVTSTIQFFRNMGATIGAAIFGSIMVRGMMSGFAGIDLSRIPPQFVNLLKNPRFLANPEALAQMKSRVPPEGLLMIGQLLEKAKSILAISLGKVFFAGMITAGAALVITLFLKEVPLLRGEAAFGNKEGGGKAVEAERIIPDGGRS
jgi:EmrB/QacA subfamily drug resistance transporter